MIAAACGWSCDCACGSGCGCGCVLGRARRVLRPVVASVRSDCVAGLSLSHCLIQLFSLVRLSMYFATSPPSAQCNAFLLLLQILQANQQKQTTCMPWNLKLYLAHRISLWLLLLLWVLFLLFSFCSCFLLLLLLLLPCECLSVFFFIVFCFLYKLSTEISLPLNRLPFSCGQPRR